MFILNINEHINNMNKYYMFLLMIILYIFSLNNLWYINTFFNKQLIWIIISICVFIIGSKFKKNFIYKHIFKLYILFNILLVYLLIFGRVINGSRAWINLFGFSLQPSEFMKLILIILLNIIPFIYNKFILKNTLLLLIPSILTFLEPDTGNVIFYIVIYLCVLFNNMDRKTILKILSVFSIVSLFIILLYFNYKGLLIKIFGLYRINRIDGLFNHDSYQLNMSLISIGSSGILGSSKLISVPFMESDFAFTLLTSLNGFLGVIIYLIVNLLLNVLILNKTLVNSVLLSNITVTFLIVKILQESINILMTIGVLPITGITLPFISYGGSSLIIYSFLLGFINNKN